MPADARFIACIFEPDDLVEVRLIPQGRRLFTTASTIATLDRKLDDANANGNGKNVYVGANPRRRKGGKAEDVALARCLFVDLDGVAPDEGVRCISGAGLPVPTCTVASGHGLHGYWRLAEPMTDLQMWTDSQKRLIALLGADPVIHDSPRIMRLPGFMNHKPPPAMCEVIHAHPQVRYSLQTIIQDPHAVAETQRQRRQQSHDFRLSAISALSATPDQVIQATLPRHEGERNACLMRLARGLKFDAGLKDKPLSEIKPIVRHWHDRAITVIGTKPFDASWSDFVRAFEVAEIPLLADPVHEALEKAKQQAAEGLLPPCAGQYDSEVVRLLVGLCANLAALRHNGRFFLSSHDAASRLGLPPAVAWRYLGMLCADEVIQRVESGDQHTATRYRWTGGHAETEKPEERERT